MNFQHAIATVIAELTPQPWDYTAGGATLTVIPAGLREDYGRAEVTIRITYSTTHAPEIGITTADMPGLLAALENGTGWRHTTILDDRLTVTAADADGVILIVTDVVYDSAARERTASVHIPEEQRLPLASALRRALDVARGWEDAPKAGESDGR